MKRFLSIAFLFASMVVLWLFLLGDLGDAPEAVAPLLIIVYAGLLGVFGASEALNSPRPLNRIGFLFSVFVRAALVGGAAILVARLIKS